MTALAAFDKKTVRNVSSTGKREGTGGRRNPSFFRKKRSKKTSLGGLLVSREFGDETTHDF
jgi:hypothetical protein